MGAEAFQPSTLCMICGQMLFTRSEALYHNRCKSRERIGVRGPFGRDVSQSDFSKHLDARI